MNSINTNCHNCYGKMRNPASSGNSTVTSTLDAEFVNLYIHNKNFKLQSGLEQLELNRIGITG